MIHLGHVMESHPRHGGRRRNGAHQLSTWSFVAMGEVGLTGPTGKVAGPIARVIARRTGRSKAKMLALIGAAFLAAALIDFLRSLDRVLVAGRLVHDPANCAPRNTQGLVHDAPSGHSRPSDQP